MSAGQRSVRVAQVNKIAELEVTCAEQERRLKQLTNERDEALKQLDDKERQLETAASDMAEYNQCYDYMDEHSTCPMNPCKGSCKENWRNRWKELAK